MKIRSQWCGSCCTTVDNVNVTLEGDSILKNVNFQLFCGEMVTIVGKNGAGKSTLVKALLGEVPFSGTIRFEDMLTGKRSKIKIGYVPQQLSFDKNTPTTVYDFFASCISKVPVWLWKKKSVYERIQKELSRFQAEDLIDKRMGDLSGGELQRVLLSVATCPKPNLLILDEPISGIDREGTVLFYKILSQLKKDGDLSILMVSHDLDFTYEYSDRILLIDGTVVEDGTPEDVYHSDAFVETFGHLPFLEEGVKGSVTGTKPVQIKGISSRRTSGKMKDEIAVESVETAKSQYKGEKVIESAETAEVAKSQTIDKDCSEKGEE